MSRALRVLNIEDSERDVELLRRHLSGAGYELTLDRVQTSADMKAALETREWDVILCDYSMPHFDALKALAVLKEMELDIPFIIISGTVGEAAAVEAMRAGAHDYLMKDNLARLGPTIEREMHEVENRRARRRAEGALRESEDRYRDLVEHSHDLICTHDLEGRVLSVNQTAARILGYDKDTLLGRNIRAVLLPDFRDEFDHYIAELEKEGIASGVMTIETRTGEKRIWEYTNTLRTEGVAVPIVRGRALDVTEQRRAEVALKASEAELRALFAAMTDVILVLDAEGRYLKIAPTDPAHLFKPQDNLIGKSLDQVFQKAEADFFLDHIRRALSEGQMHRIEYSLRINETDVWFDGSVSPLSKDSVLWIARDITERKRTEAERRLIFEIIEGVITTHNLDELLKLIHQSIGKLLYAKNCFVALYDQPRNLIHFEFWVDEFDPVPPPRPIGKGFSSYVLSTGQPLLLTKEFKSRMYERGEVEKSGRSSASWLGVPLRTASGTIGVLVLQHYEDEHAYSQRDLEFLSSVGDQIALAIERKRAEEKLRESEESYRVVAETATDVIATIDEDSTILFANRAVERVFGYAVSELLGKQITMLVPEYLRHVHKTVIGDYVRTGRKQINWESVELTGLHKTGREIPIELSFGEFTRNGRRFFTGIARDITERKQAEERLQQSDKRFRQLAENINEVFWVVDPNKNEMLYVSPAFEEIWGRTCESLYDRPHSYLQAVHPEDQKPIQAARDLRRQGMRTDDEYRIVRPDGSIRWIHDRAFPIKGEGGRVSHIVGIAENITERKRAQDALRDSEERYRLLFERNPQPMWVFDLETLAFLEVNDAAIHHYGYSREEFLKMTVKDIRPEEEIPALMKNLSGVTPRHKEAGKHKKKDGTIIDVEINSHELTFYDRPAQIVLAYDITERRSLEEQLRQSQKMEAIGQLAGGIAHDFNNLLTAITGYSELSMKRLRAEDPLLSNLQEIKKAGDRAASLTRQLLAFSRKQVLQPKVLDLNSVVSDLEKMLRRLIGEDIELRTVLEPKVGSIKVDPGQIEQIIMNLAVNARDAMPQGGKLIIETKNILLDDNYARRHIAVTPGPFVMLAVSDSGTGIDPQTQSRIFEPFFTTKGVGKGTGLGLSTVYGIVKQSGGNIWVYSEAGLGTTFKIYLPRTDESPQLYKRDSGLEEVLRGTETVLLAEDEEVVRKLACQVLRIYGYQVLEAADGKAALLICESHSAPIHLLITDVIMPGMSGRELANRLTELRPEMKVLYMSGYTDNAIVHKGVLDEGANFIQKPFSTDVLAIRVREVLDTRSKELSD